MEQENMQKILITEISQNNNKSMIIKNTNDKWEKSKYEKQHKRDKRYIRQPKKPEVKKYCCYSEGILESEPEACHNYGYDESHRKTLLPKKKTKRDRCNLS